MEGDLKPEAGTISQHEILSTLKKFGVQPPEEIQFPTTFKIDARFAISIERRSLRLTEKGVEELFNYRVWENDAVLTKRRT